MPYVVGNTGQSTCASPITAIQTTLVLASTTSFPVPSGAQFFMARIDDTGTPGSVKYEFVQVTANNTGTSTLTIVRAQESTAGQTFGAGATVTHDLTAGTLNSGFVRLDTTSQTLGGALTIPTTAGGSAAATSYGSMPVKLAEAAPAGATIDFSAIPATFRHLLIEYEMRMSRAVPNEELLLTLNTDLGSNYAWQSLRSAGTTAPASTESGAVAAGWARNIFCTGSTAPANIPGWGRISFLNYSSATLLKLLRSEWTTWATTSAFPAAGQMEQGVTTIFWNSAAAINRIQITGAGGNIASGVATLYGIP